MQKTYFAHVNATLADLRNPRPLLKAADNGEVVTLLDRGRPAYELRRITPVVDWAALEASREDWLTEAESREIAEAIARSEKTLTHDTVP
jgi:hypothetical protein